MPMTGPWDPEPGWTPSQCWVFSCGGAAFGTERVETMKKAQYFGGEHVSLPHLSGFQLRILVPSRNSGPRHPHHKRHRRAAEGHGQGPLCGRRDTGNNLLTPLSRGDAGQRLLYALYE